MYPTISLYVYVDDIDIGAHGAEKQVIQDAFGATRMLIYGLERKVLASVSRSKSLVLGSSPAVRDELQTKLASLKILVGTKGKKLGCDFTLAGRRACGTLRKRLRKYQARTGRFLALRKGAGRKRAARIHRAGAVPGAIYGMASLGASTSHLAALRRSYSRVRGLSSQFASTRLGFLLRRKDGDDPALVVHSLPINAWARTVWDQTIALPDLEDTMRWAEERRRNSRSPWLKVVGPAGATATSLARLAWTINSAVEWVDDRGITVNLLAVCPKT